MNTMDPPNYKNVLQIVHNWSPVTQLALAQDILKALSLELIPRQPQRHTLKQALGLLATEHPPADAEIAEWLIEHRLEKYGQ